MERSCYIYNQKLNGYRAKPGQGLTRIKKFAERYPEKLADEMVAAVSSGELKKVYA